MPDATCATCRWWDATGQGVRVDPPRIGLCRKSAPLRLWEHVSPLNGYVLWPETWPTDWCGEHAPSDPPTPPEVEELRALMRDPRYWRKREPEIVRRVSEGFRRLLVSEGKSDD